MAKRGRVDEKLARAKGAEVKDPMKDPRLIALKARFKEVRKQGNVMGVDMSIELGEILDETKKVLRGRYTKYVKAELAVLPATGANYMAAYRMSKESPGVMQQVKFLGLAKIYKLARMTMLARHQLFAEYNVAALNDKDFAAATAGKTKQNRKVTGNMRAHGLRMAVQAFASRLKKGLPKFKGADLKSGLQQDLSELAAASLGLAAKLD